MTNRNWKPNPNDPRWISAIPLGPIALVESPTNLPDYLNIKEFPRGFLQLETLRNCVFRPRTNTVYQKTFSVEFDDLLLLWVTIDYSKEKRRVIIERPKK